MRGLGVTEQLQVSLDTLSRPPSVIPPPTYYIPTPPPAYIIPPPPTNTSSKPSFFTHTFCELNPEGGGLLKSGSLSNFKSRHGCYQERDQRLVGFGSTVPAQNLTGVVTNGLSSQTNLSTSQHVQAGNNWTGAKPRTFLQQRHPCRNGQVPHHKLPHNRYRELL